MKNKKDMLLRFWKRLGCFHLLMFFVMALFNNCAPGERSLDSASKDPFRRRSESVSYFSQAFDPGSRKVFAHYMVCLPTYGDTVAGYKKEILEAQAVGIDGFALNLGDWTSGYQSGVANMFQAAQELGTNFQLFFSADMTGLSAAQIVQMVKLYANHPNHYRFQNHVFLSTYEGETYTASWWANNVLTPLKNAGVSVYFVPDLYPYVDYPDNRTQQATFQQATDQLIADYSSVIQGIFDFSAGGISLYSGPDSVVLTNEAYGASASKGGKTFMASYTAFYWGSRQTSAGRRYFESQGGIGMAESFDSIINVQKPQWLELITWNDFQESYLSPTTTYDQYKASDWTYFPSGTFKYHGGYLDLLKYYLAWYKTGIQPTITNDSLFYVYRTHSKDAVASNDPLGPVTERNGDVQDLIYVTTLLTEPATLQVSTGGQVKTYSVGAGIQHTKVPFAVGAQSLSLIRNGAVIASAIGDDVIANPVTYNFFQTTGFISASSGSTATTTTTSTSTTTTTTTTLPSNKDLMAPSAVITSPTSGGSVKRGSSIAVQVLVSDNVGVTRVELYVNGLLTSTANSSPFVLNFTTSGKPNASYSLQIKAYDAVGNVGLSPVIRVTSSR